MQAVNFGDLGGRISLGLGPMEEKRLDDLSINPEFEPLGDKRMAKKWIKVDEAF